MPQVIEVKTSYFINGISKLIDDCAKNNDTTRHHAAQHIISAGVGKKIKVSFNDSNIILHLPIRYVDKLRKSGMCDEAMIGYCVVDGLTKLLAT